MVTCRDMSRTSRPLHSPPPSHQSLPRLNPWHQQHHNNNREISYLVFFAGFKFTQALAGTRFQPTVCPFIRIVKIIHMTGHSWTTEVRRGGSRFTAAVTVIFKFGAGKARTAVIGQEPLCQSDQPIMFKCSRWDSQWILFHCGNILFFIFIYN